MKLYEAIELGNTLIGEDHSVFYFGFDNCGCAIGSAMAATGAVNLDTKYYSREYTEKYNVMGGQLQWVRNTWSWTNAKLKDTPLINEAVFKGVSPGQNIANAISISHHWGKPRMEIAQAIKSYEDSLEIVEKQECQTLKT